MPQDGIASGWLCTDVAAPELLALVSRDQGEQEPLTWATARLNAGDVVMLHLRVLHLSTTNTTRRIRISCDTRWQPTDDAIDPRIQATTVFYADASSST